MPVDIQSFSVSNDRASSEFVPVFKDRTPQVSPSMLDGKALSDVDPTASDDSTQSQPELEAIEESPQQEEETEARQEQATRPAKASGTRFSQLARREAELNRERQRLREERASVEEAARAAKQFEERKAKARLNPVEALQDLGLSYEEVSEFVVNDNKPTVSAEVQAVRDEIERLRQEQREEKELARQASEARLKQEQESVIQRFNEDAMSFVTSNANKFEFTIANGGEHYVPEIIEKHFHETGELLSIDKAAEIVEAHFEEVAERVARAAKFKAKTSKPAQITAPAVTQTASSTVTSAKQPVTLSNALTASASAPAQTRRTEQDRIRAALERLEGK